VPRQQLIDPADGVVCDLCQDGAEIWLRRIHAVELRRSQQRVDGRSRLPTAVGSREQEVLQMLAWMFALAVFRVGEPHRWRSLPPPPVCRRAHTSGRALANGKRIRGRAEAKTAQLKGKKTQD
jgi:hypothetical protein